MNEPETQAPAEGEAAREADKHAAMFATAVEHANGNRPGHAEEICRQILAENADHPNALYMLGALYCQRGKPDAGIEYLQRLVAMEPGGPAAYLQLANALAANNRLDEAVAQYERALSIYPEDADALTNVGIVYGRLQRPDDAEAALRRAVECNPRHAIALNNLGNCLAAKRDFAAAEQAFQQALAAEPGFAPAQNNLGNVLREQGKADEALAAYQRAVQLNGNYADALFNLAHAFAAAQRFEAAEIHYRRLLALKPDHAAAAAALAFAVDKQNRNNEVISLAKRALRLDPENRRLLGLLASAYEAANDLDAARRTVEQGLAADADDPTLNLVAAMLARRAGNYAAGIERLENLAVDGDANGSRSQIEFELGRLYDAEGNAAKAFANFSVGNSRMLKSWNAANPGENSFQQILDRKLEMFMREWVDSWPALDLPQSAATPVFLVGFPRSGTTLLDRALGSHPRIKVLQEYPAIDRLAQELAQSTDGYPEGLATLDAAKAAALRNQYFTMVNERVSRTGGQLLIDKLPFNIVAAGLIHRLFPDARFIFALRHPLDVCLSCFMQDFSLNVGMANFCDLGTTAKTYAKVMTLWQRYRELWPLPVHTVRYESLVEDFEGGMRDLLAFCGVDWNPAVLDFATAGRGNVNTPSYHQVSRPIYAEARNRWERYAEQLEPIRPTVEPFIEAFGYSD